MNPNTVINQCFCCNKQTECPSLYYILNPMTYIDPKTYKYDIPKNVERICSDCIVEFILQRNKYKVCPKCNAYYNNYTKHPCLLSEPKKLENDNCVLCSNKWDDEVNCPANQDYIPKIECIGENLVSVGMEGIFKIISDEIIINQGIICNKCLNNFTCEPHLNMECSNCHKKFSDMMCGNNMAYGCSATIYDSMILCHYGSDRDGDTIQFLGKDYKNIDTLHSIKITDNPISIYIVKGNDLIINILDDKPKHLKYGWNICDVCIDTLIGEENCHKILNILNKNNELPE